MIKNLNKICILIIFLSCVLYSPFSSYSLKPQDCFKNYLKDYSDKNVIAKIKLGNEFVLFYEDDNNHNLDEIRCDSLHFLGSTFWKANVMQTINQVDANYYTEGKSTNAYRLYYGFANPNEQNITINGKIIKPLLVTINNVQYGFWYVILENNQDRLTISN